MQAFIGKRYFTGSLKKNCLLACFFEINLRDILVP